MSQNQPVVIKNKLLINISGNSSLVQRKLFNTFIYKIYNDLGDFTKPYFFFRIQEVNDLMGYKKKIDYSQFRQDCNALMRTFVSWDVLGKDKSVEEWEDSVLVSNIQLKEGMIRLEIPLGLRERLIENKQYIKLNLSIQKKFTSKYSLIIYELAKEFYREKDEKGESPWIEMEKFKPLLGLESNDYSDFKVFNRNILTRSIKEINGFSDIICVFQFKRTNRKTSHIKLIISKNIEFSLFDKKETQETSEPPQPSPLKNSILSLGINEKQIDEWFEDYTVEYIESKYNITIEQLKLGKIKTSPTGFLIKAIELDFGSKKNNIEDLLIQDALEARKLNPETIIVNPFDFGSIEDLHAKLDTLRGQFYNPIVIQSELDNVMRIKWTN